QPALGLRVPVHRGGRIRSLLAPPARPHGGGLRRPPLPSRDTGLDACLRPPRAALRRSVRLLRSRLDRFRRAPSPALLRGGASDLRPPRDERRLLLGHGDDPGGSLRRLERRAGGPRRWLPRLVQGSLALASRLRRRGGDRSRLPVREPALGERARPRSAAWPHRIRPLRHDALELPHADALPARRRDPPLAALPPREFRPDALRARVLSRDRAAASDLVCGGPAPALRRGGLLVGGFRALRDPLARGLPRARPAPGPAAGGLALALLSADAGASGAGALQPVRCSHRFSPRRRG